MAISKDFYSVNLKKKWITNEFSRKRVHLIRSENDWANTYVLDTAVNNVFFKAQQMIPKAYHDILGMDSVE